jgi:fucose permease
MILGLAGAFFLPRFLFVASALVVIFAAFGLFEVSVNALATQVLTSRAALLMSLLHFFYGAGSSLSPRAAGAVSAALDWRSVYLFSIPLVLLFFVPALFTRFPRAEAEGGAGVKKAGFFTALKTPMVWIFSVALGLMVVVELCSANWAGLYFQDVYGLDPRTSVAGFLSGFYILFTISRLLSGFAIEKIGYMRSLLVAALAAVLIFTGGFMLGDKGIYVLPGLGFFAATFWPTLLATAMGYFKDDSPVMTSAIIVIAGAINSGIQFVIGFTNRLAGPAWGYRSCPFYALLIIAALMVLSRYMRRPYKPAADAAASVGPEAGGPP